jgi:hypothetical protein
MPVEFFRLKAEATRAKAEATRAKAEAAREKFTGCSGLRNSHRPGVDAEYELVGQAPFE